MSAFNQEIAGSPVWTSYQRKINEQHPNCRRESQLITVGEWSDLKEN